MHHCCFTCEDEHGKKAQLSIQWNGSNAPLERSVLRSNLPSQTSASHATHPDPPKTMPFPGSPSFMEHADEFSFYLGQEELAVLDKNPLTLVNRNGRTWRLA